MKMQVIDGIMGSGKTSWAIQLMNKAEKDLVNFIYVTPYLDETKRIKEEVISRNFKTPLGADEQQGERISKLEQLKTFLALEEDVVITHELFKNFDDEIFELLDRGKYTLILDEVMNVVNNVPLRQGDIRLLLRHNIISIDEATKQVTWLDRDYYFSGTDTDDDNVYDDEEDNGRKNARFIDIKRYADSGNLYAYNDQFMIWQLPIRLFKHFENIFILTYLFECQLQAYYYKFHGLAYELKSVVKDDFENYKLTAYDRNLDVSKRKEYAKLIKIYQGKLNDVGEKRTALGTNFVKRMSKADRDQVTKNLYNYFKNIVNAVQDEVIWTTKKDNRKLFAPRGFKTVKKGSLDCFVSHNVRATNEYKDRRVCAYIYNRFMQPHEKAFFNDAGVAVDENLLALSDMVQWIWRSRIREGHPIDVYIPSKRMRNLLTDWINGDI